MESVKIRATHRVVEMKAVAVMVVDVMVLQM